MRRRSLLRKQIALAGARVITTDYVKQRVNSERSLQASMWANLNKLLPSTTRRMFIEPPLSARSPSSAVRYPDIVICNTRSVIGIIELKYQPRVRPSWSKDVATFQWIGSNLKQLSICNRRFRGVEFDAKTYPVADDALFVWAGIHAPCDDDLHVSIGDRLAGQPLVLHAVTGRDKKPEIVKLARSAA